MKATPFRKFLRPACLLVVVCAPGLVGCSRFYARQAQSSIETTEGAVIRVPDGFTIERVADRREVILTGWNVLNTASLRGPESLFFRLPC